MFLISVPNLKEIHLREDYCFKLVWRRRRRKMWRKLAILKNAYLTNYLSEFLQIWYVMSCIWRCKFDRNWSSSYRDMKCWNGDLVVPVNNTLVCCTSFLAADTRPCVLILCSCLNNIEMTSDILVNKTAHWKFFSYTSFSCK